MVNHVITTLNENFVESASRNFSLSYLSWSDFDIKMVPLVGDLQYLWPRKSVDAESVSVDQKSTSTDS